VSAVSTLVGDDRGEVRAKVGAVRAVEVLRAGPLTTVQDLGRPGYAHLGVARSGAADRGALKLVNRAVGNQLGAAVLETTIGGIAVRALGPLVVAVGGAVAPVTVDGVPAAWCAPIRLAAGSVLDVGPATLGVRSSIAFAGGVDLPPVLGSRSTDLLAGLGPAPLRDGDQVPIGPAAHDADDAAAFDFLPFQAPRPEFELPLLPAPRPGLFADGALASLAAAEYTVSSASNRIALRLEGPAVRRAGADTMPSEGTVLGAVQVPADGRPIVFLADHPPTGGYPVLGVVPEAALDLCAQAAPGARVKFRAAGHLG
jgi:biotin-dependent carboxylase-like uncharacterized protein